MRKWVAVISAYECFQISRGHAAIMATMEKFLRSLAKAELHVHLEGSITPETVLELEPSLTREEVLARYRYDNFPGFLDAYKWVNHFLRTPDDYALITRRLLRALAEQGVHYAEINLSIGVLLWRNQEFEPNFAAIAAAAADGPIPARFIFDAVRQFGLDPAWKVARLAAANRHRGVIGFGIGGDEARGPAHLFHEVFAFAREAGLHILPHAGESGGPESVWSALEGGAARIGHGIRAIEDPSLVKHLRDHRIPLEISISSNLCTGVVASLDQHPVRRLYDAGVPITLNTDDPPMFHTTLLNEYLIAHRHFGFSRDELRQLAQNSLNFALDYHPPSPS